MEEEPFKSLGMELPATLAPTQKSEKEQDQEYDASALLDCFRLAPNTKGANRDDEETKEDPQEAAELKEAI